MESKTFIETILTIDNVAGHYKFIDETALSDPDKLLPLFVALVGQGNDLDNSWQLRSAYDRIIESVCLHAGVDQILTAIEIFNQLKQEKHKRTVAAFLSSKQVTGQLLQVILSQEKNIDPYLVSLIIHELASRGHDLRTYPEFYVFASAVNEQSIFKSLPLYPLGIEKDLSLRNFNVGSSGHSNDFGLYNQKFVKLKSGERIINDFEEVDEIKLVFQDWTDQSNGSSIGLRGSFPFLLSPENILAQIAYEPFYATEVKIQAITPQRAYQLLFGACANGGAYSNGEYGAVARLYTWRALHAMVSELPFSTSASTASLMEGCDWFEFLLDKWFINEWLDVGVLGASKISNQFALVTGTDTD